MSGAQDQHKSLKVYFIGFSVRFCLVYVLVGWIVCLRKYIVLQEL